MTEKLLLWSDISMRRKLKNLRCLGFNGEFKYTYKSSIVGYNCRLTSTCVKEEFKLW